MAITGLSKPIFGEYYNTSGTVNYYNGFSCGHAVEYSVDFEFGDDNPLYGDNEIVETDPGAFKSGTLTLSTSELTDAVSKKLLGLKTVTRTSGTGESAVTYSETVFDDNRTNPIFGFGIIEECIVDGATKYHTIVLPKVIAKIPSLSAKTRGESIEWQTPSIEFSIYKSDETNATTATNRVRPYMFEVTHDTESAAIAYLNLVLGVGATPPTSTT